MGGESSTHETDENYIQNFSRNGRRYHVGNRRERVILKLIINK